VRVTIPEIVADCVHGSRLPLQPVFSSLPRRRVAAESASPLLALEMLQREMVMAQAALQRPRVVLSH